MGRRAERDLCDTNPGPRRERNDDALALQKASTTGYRCSPISCTMPEHVNTGMEFMNNPRPGEKIQLTESYESLVSVHSGDNRFSGRLILSPEKITLVVSGDLHDDRNYELNRFHLDSLECYAHNSLKYLLLGLDSFYNEAQCLGGVRHFEVNYDVSHAFVLPHSFDAEDIVEVNVFSPTIEEWVGATKAQYRFLSSYGQPEIEKPLESVVFAPVEGVGTLEICYETHSYHSPQSRSAGIACTLYTNFTTSFPWSSEDVLSYLDNLRSFFGVLHGDEPTITAVQICENADSALPGYLYYPTAEIRPHLPDLAAVFPLSKDPAFPQGLPEFPTAAISAFFSQGKAGLARWQKYIRYRKIGAMEDRFLGIFRLLEALTLEKKPYLDAGLLEKALRRLEPMAIRAFGNRRNVQSFLGRLPKVNESKYNTETCIRKFLARIPEAVRSAWKFQATDLNRICALRNDITHANDYYVSEDDLLDQTYFVNTLLYFALLESIGVSLETTAAVASRIDGSGRIKKRKEG